MDAQGEGGVDGRRLLLLMVAALGEEMMVWPGGSEAT